MNRFRFPIIISTLLLAIDQFFKIIVSQKKISNTFNPLGIKIKISDIVVEDISIIYSYIIPSLLLILIGVLIFKIKTFSKTQNLSMCIISGGLLSNIINQSHQVSLLDDPNLPLLNFADLYIAFFIIIMLSSIISKRGTIK
jgi:lipoprotein signal peptidase